MASSQESGEMSEIRNRDRILEAIDQLRRRKARPDAERICNFLSRRFAVDAQDTIADLERLVEEDVVVKVEYKGNISYRNAAKWSRYSVYTKAGVGTLNSEGMSSLLSGAVAELIIQEPDYLDFGVPGPELEKYMQEKDSSRFTKRYLELILQRELMVGNIVKLENGNYWLADHPVPSSSNISTSSSGNDTVKVLKMDSPSSSQHVSEEEDGGGRSQSEVCGIFFETKKDSTDSLAASSASTEGKRKRSKEVFFDPSDVHVQTRKHGRPLGSTNKNKALGKAVTVAPRVEVDKGFCCVCMDRGDNLMSCKDCTNRAHASCVEELCPGAQWQCLQCKTCCVCMETAEKEAMAACSSCGESYHESCHEPGISDTGRDFVCAHCSSTPKTDPDVDASIPDVSSWSVEQVCKYLEEQGYPVQAAVFRDHDIDGASLLLMKRSDVLVGLHLKLGPALKVYGR